MASSLQLNFIKKFSGYKNYRDVTNLAPTDLAVGSQNVFVTDGVRLDVRGGTSLLGAGGTVGVNTDPSWTLANRIHSHYDTFVNNQGVTMPFRVWYSGTSAQGDVMEAWLPVYSAGVATPVKKWYQVNANAPSNPIVSAHKWYFAEWFDSLNDDNRIVFTYGSPTVQSYSGGFSPIVSVTSNTITTNGTWVGNGFINAPEGINTIVVNVAGVPTEIPLTSGDFTGSTITVASTTGIAVNDIAFQAFNADLIVNQTTPTNFNADVCQTLGNQVYYIDWKQRNVYLSWAFNQTAFNTSPVYSGSSGLNDAVFSGTFTDTQTDVYQVMIDGVASQSQTFTGTGSNSSYFDTSGYTGIGSNTYTVSIISDSVFTPSAGSGSFANGELIVGQTSGAVIKVIAGGNFSGGAALTQYVSGSPEAGEVFKGISSGVSRTLFQFTFSNSATLYRNGAQVVGLTGMVNFPPTNGILQLATAGNQIVTPSQIDGLQFVTTQVGGNAVGDYYTLTINNADTYSWSLNGTNMGNHISMSLSPQLLSNGVFVNFQQISGHAVGDSWNITYYPTIHRGWRQVYYTGYNLNPGATSGTSRLPGEGYKLQLDSNGWAMQPQQNAMYINGQGGEYYEVTVKFSANLQNQTYSNQRLKTEPQKKALYPYLMTSEPNYLSVVSAELTWDILGQQKFLELPQSKTFSDFVKNDFLNAQWLNSEQFYTDRKQWFVLPEQNQVFVYDDFMKYWHPPQSFGRRVASMCVIDGQICGHSYERNETYQLFTDDLNDLGLFPINTQINLSYYDWNRRYNKKTINAVAFDGYMQGAPVISWKVNGGVGGCEFQQKGVINPIYCNPVDTASLGKSGLGYHGLGNSPQAIVPHFVYGKTFTEQNYYLRDIELSCSSMEQLWSITSFGEVVKMDMINNSDIFNP